MSSTSLGTLRNINSSNRLNRLLRGRQSNMSSRRKQRTSDRNNHNHTKGLNRLMTRMNNTISNRQPKNKFHSNNRIRRFIFIRPFTTLSRFFFRRNSRNMTTTRNRRASFRGNRGRHPRTFNLLHQDIVFRKRDLLSFVLRTKGPNIGDKRGTKFYFRQLCGPTGEQCSLPVPLWSSKKGSKRPPTTLFSNPL